MSTTFEVQVFEKLDDGRYAWQYVEVQLKDRTEAVKSFTQMQSDFPKKNFRVTHRGVTKR